MDELVEGNIFAQELLQACIEPQVEDFIKSIPLWNIS